jgi:hypothetical protein
VTDEEFCAAIVVLNENRRSHMSLGSHLDELKKKHENLSDKVENVQRTPSASDAEISDLKKQKLRIKEEIERLSVG